MSGQEGERKLFVGGIGNDISENHLRNYFGEYGEVENVVVLFDKITGKSRGYGFVTMSSVDDFARVLETQEHAVDGKTIHVNKATKPRDAPLDSPRESGSKRPYDGERRRSNSRENEREGKYARDDRAPRGGYRDYDRPAGDFDGPRDYPPRREQRAPSPNGERERPRDFHRDEAPADNGQVDERHAEEDKEPREHGNRSRVFVGNLHYSTNEEVTEYFQRFGPFDDIEFKVDDNGNPRNFGFISYKSPKTAEFVVQQQHVLNGKKLFVNWAQRSRGGVEDRLREPRDESRERGRRGGDREAGGDVPAPRGGDDRRDGERGTPRGGPRDAAPRGDPRDFRGDPRDYRDPRGDPRVDPRGDPRVDPRVDPRGDPREFRGDPRDFRGDPRDFRGDPRDYRPDPRADPRDFRGDPRDFRGDPRDFRGDPRDFRGDPRDYRPDPREYRGDPRDFRPDPRGDPRDYRGDPRDFRGDYRFDPRGPPPGDWRDYPPYMGPPMGGPPPGYYPPGPGRGDPRSDVRGDARGGPRGDPRDERPQGRADPPARGGNAGGR